MASFACWTCRARKKKCPGPSINSPSICTTCTTLHITCYGFGAAAKPSWLEGQTATDKKERAKKMEEIRSGVKRTTDSLRRTRALSGLRQPGGERSSEVGHHSWLVTDTSSPSTVSLSQIPSSNGTAPTASPSITRLSPCDPAELHSQLEAILLMHYFDHILPLQFPFYQPSIADGGRGWLLALLLQTRPLYDAALSLAAWHRNATMRRDPSKGKLDHGETREQGHEQAWGCEEHLYGRAIAGLRERIEILSQKGPEEGLKGSIEVLACIVQLILLEVSKGDMKNWQKHLQAAPDLHVFLRTYCTPQHLLSNSRTSFHESSNQSAISFVDHAAMEFFSGVIIWFDILGSASTGLRPQYADICAAALGDVDSKVQLQNLMGCENWAMTIIREIAVLEDWKRETASDGVVSLRELVRRASDIKQRLESGIARLTERLSQVSNVYGAYVKNSLDMCSKDLVVSSITHVFACAAQVYLSAIVSGPKPNLPEMRGNVARTLAALNALPGAKLIRNVVWPFCIAGCMAAHDQEPKFRDLASAVKIDKHTFGTSWRALEVMETCWMMRRSPETENGTDWFTAMKKLGVHILLV